MPMRRAAGRMLHPCRWVQRVVRSRRRAPPGRGGSRGQDDAHACVDIAGGELIGRRQDTATNQMLSHTLEQLLVRSKRFRDTEAAAMNMRLVGMRDGRTTATSIIAGTADDLRTWRQP